MSQGLSVQAFDADYVIQVNAYLLWFSVHSFLPTHLFHHCFSVPSLFLFQLFPSSHFIPNIIISYILYSIVTSTRTFPLLFFWWFAFFWKILFFETFSIVVGSCPCVMWIGRLRWGDKIVVVKIPVTDHRSSSKKSGKIAMFQKPQVLQKHRHFWEFLY